MIAIRFQDPDVQMNLVATLEQAIDWASQRVEGFNREREWKSVKTVDVPLWMAASLRFYGFGISGEQQLFGEFINLAAEPAGPKEMIVDRRNVGQPMTVEPVGEMTGPEPATTWEERCEQAADELGIDVA